MPTDYCKRCGEYTPQVEPVDDAGWHCSKCLARSDLDAAWAWFRESDYDLSGGDSVGWCVWKLFRDETVAGLGQTRDGAVLAAWRAAAKQNNEKGEGGRVMAIEEKKTEVLQRDIDALLDEREELISERDRYRELVEELLASDEEVSSVTDDELSDAAQKAPCPAARRQAEVILAARQALKAGKEGA